MIPSNKEKEIYSTEETRIGKWIDGKPLYRKMFTGTTASYDTTENVTRTNIAFIVDTLIDAYGYVQQSTNAQFKIGGINTLVAKAGNYIRLESDRNSFAEKPYTLVIEYTKTTD